MRSPHSLRVLLTLVALLGNAALPGQGSHALAGTWHHRLGRELGIGWGDGYHSREGCPSEHVGRRKYPGYPGGDAYSGPASPQRAWMGHVAEDGAQVHPAWRGPPLREELPYSPEIGDPKIGQPTPAEPKRPVPAVDPSLPGKSSSHESRRPSQMFPLAPIR